MESLVGYGSDDESNEMLQENKGSTDRGLNRLSRQEEDVNYDNVQMDMSEESNNNHSSADSSSTSSGTSSSSSGSESDSDSEKHLSSSSSHTFSSADGRGNKSPKEAASAETPETTTVRPCEPTKVPVTSESDKNEHQSKNVSNPVTERIVPKLQNSSHTRKHMQSSEDKKRSHSPDRKKPSRSPSSRRRSRSSEKEKVRSHGSRKRRSRSRSRDHRRRGASSRSPERRKRSSPSRRERSDRKRSSRSPSARRRRSRTPDRKKRSHSPSRTRRSGDRERERDRRSRSPAHRRPYEKKPNKLTILERLGIEIKPPNDPTAQPVTPQQLLQHSAEEQARQIKSTTGIEFPKYYNPAAMNPARYAEQMQKRRLLWGNKSASSTAVKSDSSVPQSSTNKWEGTTFAQDQDGKMTAKFKRLMGIKDTSQGNTASSGEEGSEILKKQEEMFNSMEMQYEVARVATHTHRGVGLGFGTFQYPR